MFFSILFSVFFQFGVRSPLWKQVTILAFIRISFFNDDDVRDYEDYAAISATVVSYGFRRV